MWGEEGKNEHDGYGLSKLVRWHPEVLDDLQGVISSMEVVKRSENRAMLESADHKGGVRLQWYGARKHWLLTAFRKDEAKGSGVPRTDTNTEAQVDDSLPTYPSDDIVDQKLNEFHQGKNGARGAFNPETVTVTLFKGADLSTALHEGAHFFFENDIALAGELLARGSLTPGEQQIVDDVSRLMAWHNIQGDIDAQLAQWATMPFEEKRTYHERTAESFEAYLFSGKSPSIELQPYFQKFRAWLLNVYDSLKAFLKGHPEAGKLNDEVRGVFDRMLATNEQIALAEQGRSMMPLFASPEQAGMTPEEFAAYQALGVDATAEAIEDLQARGLRDMTWLHNARGRIIKQLQKDAEAQRAQMRMDVRREVMSQPVYRAWQFLTGKLTADDKIAPPAKRKSDPNVVDETRDSLFAAIAKLGGLNKDAVVAEWDADPKGKPQSGAFGKPVWRINNGLSLDAMGATHFDSGKGRNSAKFALLRPVLR